MKSSLLALALFFFLSALLASKPSSASRHEPSLLNTDGNNHFVSALREVVDGGLNLINAVSDDNCPEVMGWPELEGKTEEEAVSFIKKQYPCLEVIVCPASGAICLIRIRFLHKVRLWVDQATGLVDRVPFIG